MSAILAHMVWP